MRYYFFSVLCFCFLSIASASENSIIDIYGSQRPVNIKSQMKADLCRFLMVDSANINFRFVRKIQDLNFKTVVMSKQIDFEESVNKLASSNYQKFLVTSKNTISLKVQTKLNAAEYFLLFADLLELAFYEFSFKYHEKNPAAFNRVVHHILDDINQELKIFRFDNSLEGLDRTSEMPEANFSILAKANYMKNPDLQEEESIVDLALEHMGRQAAKPKEDYEFVTHSTHERISGAVIDAHTLLLSTLSFHELEFRVESDNQAFIEHLKLRILYYLELYKL